MPYHHSWSRTILENLNGVLKNKVLHVWNVQKTYAHQEDTAGLRVRRSGCRWICMFTFNSDSLGSLPSWYQVFKMSLAFICRKKRNRSRIEDFIGQKWQTWAPMDLGNPSKIWLEQIVFKKYTYLIHFIPKILQTQPCPCPRGVRSRPRMGLFYGPDKPCD